MTEKDVFNAFKRSLKKYGSQNKLSQKTGVPQSTINDLCNGNKQIGNITVTNFLKLFPKIQIDFFGSETPNDHISEIVKMLSRLTDDDQRQIMLSIAVHYPKSREEKIQKFVKKL